MKFKEKIILFLRATYARAYVRIIATHREGYWIIFYGFSSLISVASYIFLYRNLGAPKNFESFVILGSFVLAFWLNVLWALASQFYWEKLSGNLRYFIIAPCSKMSILLGMAIGGIYMIIFRAFFVLIAAFLIFKTPLKVERPIFVFLSFFITLIGLYGLGMAFSSLYLLWGREAWHLSNLFQEPVYALSGLYFPVRTVGVFLAFIASIIPLTLGLDSLRQAFFGKNAFPLLKIEIEILILFLLSLFFLFLAYISLNKMEEVAKKEGKLLERWG